MLHTMYFADEVRSFGEIDRGESAKIKAGELELALQLIDGLASEAFEPDKYADEHRQRVLDLVNRKVEGQEVTAVGPQVQRAQVIDLMEALKQSLARRMAAQPAAPDAEAGAPAGAEKKPLAKARRAEAPAPAKKAQAGKK
jgi:DNA end-binding protein Ku